MEALRRLSKFQIPFHIVFAKGFVSSEDLIMVLLVGKIAEDLHSKIADNF